MHAGTSCKGAVAARSWREAHLFTGWYSGKPIGTMLILIEMESLMK